MTWPCLVAGRVIRAPVLAVWNAIVIPVPIPVPITIVLRPAVAVMVAIAVATIPVGIIVDKAAGQQADGRDH
jgi:hypothetical protein